VRVAPLIGTGTNYDKHRKVLRHFQCAPDETILTEGYLPDNRDFMVQAKFEGSLATVLLFALGEGSSRAIADSPAALKFRPF
jgi:hypothetical protein